MNNILHNIISLFLISCILIVLFYEVPVENRIDFKKEIVDFTNAEDSRNIDKVLSFYEFPVLNYWKYKEISKIDLKELYLSYWKRYEYSENEIQKIDKISDDEFVLTTKYIYSKNIRNLNRYRLSETKFRFNELGKITSIINLSLQKIDHEYILNHNLIRDFSYVENIPQKKDLGLVPLFTVLLLINLSIQAISSFNKRKKDSKVTNVFKDEIELNRLIKIEETEKLKEITKSDTTINLEKEKIEADKKQKTSKYSSIKQSQEKLKKQRELDKVIQQVEEADKRLKEKAKREHFIRLEKEKIEKEKKEAARIKRNKLAREKRRLEQEQKEKEAAKRKRQEARIQREKLVIKEREDKEREKREKEELELRQQQELTTSNIEIVDESEDPFFDDNLSQYITEIPDDDIDETESDIGDFLTDKYMPQNLKNKLKKK